METKIPIHIFLLALPLNSSTNTGPVRSNTQLLHKGAFVVRSSDKAPCFENDGTDSIILHFVQFNSKAVSSEDSFGMCTGRSLFLRMELKLRWSLRWCSSWSEMANALARWVSLERTTEYWGSLFSSSNRCCIQITLSRTSHISRNCIELNISMVRGNAMVTNFSNTWFFRSWKLQSRSFFLQRIHHDKASRVFEKSLLLLKKDPYFFV